MTSKLRCPFHPPGHHFATRTGLRSVTIKRREPQIVDDAPGDFEGAEGKQESNDTTSGRPQQTKHPRSTESPGTCDLEQELNAAQQGTRGHWRKAAGAEWVKDVPNGVFVRRMYRMVFHEHGREAADQALENLLETLAHYNQFPSDATISGVQFEGCVLVIGDIQDKDADADANQIVTQLREYRNLQPKPTSEKYRRVAVLYGRLQEMSNNLLDNSEPFGAVVAVIKKTEASCAAVAEALKELFPGFADALKLGAIDEIDSGTMADTKKMENLHVTICQHISSIFSPGKSAMAEYTATDAAPKLANPTKYAQAGCGNMVPRRACIQRRPEKNNYAGIVEMYRTGADGQQAPNVNIVPTSDYNGYAMVPEKLSLPDEQQKIFDRMRQADPGITSSNETGFTHASASHILGRHASSTEAPSVSLVDEDDEDTEQDQGQQPRARMHDNERVNHDLLEQIACGHEMPYDTQLLDSRYGAVIDFLIASAEQYRREFGHREGWLSDGDQHKLQDCTLGHLLEPASRPLSDTHTQLPDGLLSAQPMQQVGLIKLCQQHATTGAHAVSEEDFDATLVAALAKELNHIELSCPITDLGVQQVLNKLKETQTINPSQLTDPLRKILFQSPIFGQDANRSVSQSSAGMRLLFVMHEIFQKLGKSLKLCFLSLDFEQPSNNLPGGSVRLAYHKVAGGICYPLGSVDSTTPVVYVLANPNPVRRAGGPRRPISRNDAFPVVLPFPEARPAWNQWCASQEFVSAAKPPAMHFQTSLFNTGRLTRLHSKEADVLEQILFMTQQCIHPWIVKRITEDHTACDLQLPADDDGAWQNFSSVHKQALQARFGKDVERLTAPDGLLDQRWRHMRECVRNSEAGHAWPSLPELRPFLERLLRPSVNGQPRVQVVILNSGDPKDRRCRREVIYDEKAEAQHQAPEVSIEVASQKRDRGITSPKLLVMVLLREANKFLSQSLVQQHRIFGHLAGYEDLVQIWTSARASLTMMCIREHHIRQQVQHHHKAAQGENPMHVPVSHNPCLYKPTNTVNMRDTKASKLQGGAAKAQFAAASNLSAPVAFPEYMKMFNTVLDQYPFAVQTLANQSGQAMMFCEVDTEIVTPCVGTLSGELADRIASSPGPVNVAFALPPSRQVERAYANAFITDKQGVTKPAAPHEVQYDHGSGSSPSKADEMVGKLLYCGSKVKDKNTPRNPRTGYKDVHQREVPQAFWDVEGSFNDEFRSSTVSQENSVWYTGTEVLAEDGAAGDMQTDEAADVSAVGLMDMDRHPPAPWLIVWHLMEGNYIAKAKNGERKYMFYAKDHPDASTLPLPAVTCWIPQREESIDILRRGQVAYRDEVASEIIDQPVITTELKKHLGSLLDMGEALLAADTQCMLSPQVNVNDDQPDEDATLPLSLKRVQGMLQLSKSKAAAAHNPGLVPYMRHQSLCSDVFALFRQARQRHGENSALLDLEEQWLCDWSDKVETLTNPTPEKLHKLLEQAQISQPKQTFAEAHSNLQQAAWATGKDMQKNIKAQVERLQVFSFHPTLVHIKDALDRLLNTLLRRISGRFFGRYSQTNSTARLYVKVQSIACAVSALVKENLDCGHACLPSIQDLPEIVPQGTKRGAGVAPVSQVSDDQANLQGQESAGSDDVQDEPPLLAGQDEADSFLVDTGLGQDNGDEVAESQLVLSATSQGQDRHSENRAAKRPRV